MKHLGDITKIQDPPYVDCITFGSPCQDLSSAGNRAGLKGERSGLFMEAVRIIKEMRKKSGNRYPTFAVWENVPGAFSSNGGEDFRTVLEELVRIAQPDASIPRPARWAKAGLIRGDRWSLAWRTLNAEFWGVPQRRRRIALVVDFGGQRAGEILFERKGVRGDSEPRIQTWKGVAKNPAIGAGGYDSVVEDPAAYTLKNRSGCEGGGKGALVQKEKSATLSTLQDQTLFCLSSASACATIIEDCSPTITCQHDGATIVFESHGQDARYKKIKNASPPCTAHWGTGGNNMPIVLENRSKEESCLSPWDNRSRRVYSEDGSFPALASRGRAGQNQQAVVQKGTRRWVVRRLMPVECERLQGFPDGWTDIGDWVDSKGKLHKAADSPRYRALGNSIALPQWWWLVCKMAKFLPEKATLGSLFDGIGGFPLVWETLHGKGTAVWASEIEEFPIAVTKARFPEVDA